MNDRIALFTVVLAVRRSLDGFLSVTDGLVSVFKETDVMKSSTKPLKTQCNVGKAFTLYSKAAYSCAQSKNRFEIVFREYTGNIESVSSASVTCCCEVILGR